MTAASCRCSCCYCCSISSKFLQLIRLFDVSETRAYSPYRAFVCVQAESKKVIIIFVYENYKSACVRFHRHGDNDDVFMFIMIVTFMAWSLHCYSCSDRESRIGTEHIYKYNRPLTTVCQWWCAYGALLHTERHTRVHTPHPRYAVYCVAVVNCFCGLSKAVLP